LSHCIEVCRCRRYGYVEYEDPNSLEGAIALDRTTFGDIVLQVARAKPVRSPPTKQRKPTKLYVRGARSKEELVEAFSSYGEIRSLFIGCDYRVKEIEADVLWSFEGPVLSYAVIQFQHLEDAQAAAAGGPKPRPGMAVGEQTKELSTLGQGWRYHLDVRRGDSRWGGETKDYSICIKRRFKTTAGRLTPGGIQFSSRSLHNAFVPYGDVVRARVVEAELDEYGLIRRPRDFGFATFSTKEAAEAALLGGPNFDFARGIGLKEGETWEVERFEPTALGIRIR